MMWIPMWVVTHGHHQELWQKAGVKAFSHSGKVFPLGTSSERDLGCVETGALDTWPGWWAPP